MKYSSLATLTLFAVCSYSGYALAEDAQLCLDCHEPAEDWQGMSVDEVLAEASDLDIKRHADNAEFSEEQLKAMITKLLAQ